MALWTGYGIAWRGVLSILLAALPVILLYAYRIVIEERMLVDALPAYEGYRRRTWRLLPGIW
jgi:protein-S-isoprenylcysteine O-methyltransferase Ste14